MNTRLSNRSDEYLYDQLDELIRLSKVDPIASMVQCSLDCERGRRSGFVACQQCIENELAKRKTKGGEPMVQSCEDCVNLAAAELLAASIRQVRASMIEQGIGPDVVEREMFNLEAAYTKMKGGE